MVNIEGINRFRSLDLELPHLIVLQVRHVFLPLLGREALECPSLHFETFRHLNIFEFADEEVLHDRLQAFAFPKRLKFNVREGTKTAYN